MRDNALFTEKILFELIMSAVLQKSWDIFLDVKYVACFNDSGTDCIIEGCTINRNLCQIATWPTAVLKLLGGGVFF